MKPLSVLLFLAIAVAAIASDQTNALPPKITIAGETYEDVTWGTVTPSSVSIRHKTGIARIPLESLPPALQQQLGYDPKKATAYRSAEAAAQAQREKQSAESKVLKASERQPVETQLRQQNINTSVPQHEQKKSAAAIEKIQFLAVGAIQPSSGGRFTAALRSIDGVKVCAVFDAMGKAYLEGANRKRGSWEQKQARYEKELAKGPQLEVKKQLQEFQRGSTIGLEPVVTDVKLVEPAKPPPEPSFVVFGVQSESDCFTLLGKQERVGMAGKTTYEW